MLKLDISPATDDVTRGKIIATFTFVVLVGAWANVNCPVFACDLSAEGQRRNGLLMIPQTDVLARNKILGRTVSFFAIKTRIDVRPDSQPLLVYSSLWSSFMLLRLRSVPSYAASRGYFLGHQENWFLEITFPYSMQKRVNFSERIAWETGDSKSNTMKPERGELGKSGLASFGFRCRVDIVRKEFVRATFISVYLSSALVYSKLNGWVAALHWPARSQWFKSQ